MQCLQPVILYRSCKKNESGLYGLTRNVKNMMNEDYNNLHYDTPNKMIVPCGECVACMMSRARTWSLRAMHESLYHNDSCFVTLTYRRPLCKYKKRTCTSCMEKNKYCLSALNVIDMQLFLKRLRKTLPSKIKYVYTGEYGSKTYRPHWHIIIFGYSPKDLVHTGTTKSGCKEYTSKTLEALWTHGMVSIGKVTPQSVQYVTRYITNKINSDMAPYHQKGKYKKGKPVMYVTRSSAGFGRQYLIDNLSSIRKRLYNNPISSEVIYDIANNRFCSPPRYYLKILKTQDVEIYYHIRGLMLAREQLELSEEEYNFQLYVQKETLKKLKRLLD